MFSVDNYAKEEASYRTEFIKRNFLMRISLFPVRNVTTAGYVRGRRKELVKAKRNRQVIP
jgi:hypothetical protein